MLTMPHWSGSIALSPVVEPVALLALAIDAAIGWPQGVYRAVGHPVGGFARIIAACERVWNRADRNAGTRRFAGIGLVILLVLIAVGVGWGLEWLARLIAGRWAWILIALFAAPGLAQRSLYDHVIPVARALASGDLPAARRAAAMIVGRDVEPLDEAGIARAAIESLAESFCDGVAAPLFWLLLLGLPGLWAYKAINTADSLVGHREERWRHFGWAAARIDDAVNLIPARIAGAVICLAGPGGWRTLWRDHARHASPNAGWPEAAMAGALGVALAGPVAYDGARLDKVWIGCGTRDASVADLLRGLRIYIRACLILWVIAGGVAWAL
jgi:adenosylcobinamide-phosphate synthase